MTKPAAAPISRAVNVRSTADISDAIADGLERGSLLLSESNLSPEFFNLRSGMAGEMLQKFVNYRIPLAIVVVAPEGYGERFCELVREHQSHPSVRFFSCESQAREWLCATS